MAARFECIFLFSVKIHITTCWSDSSVKVTMKDNVQLWCNYIIIKYEMQLKVIIIAVIIRCAHCFVHLVDQSLGLKLLNRAAINLIGLKTSFNVLHHILPSDVII